MLSFILHDRRLTVRGSVERAVRVIQECAMMKRNRANVHTNGDKRSQAGFSLVEAVFSLGIVSIGLLSMGTVLTRGMVHLNGSQAELIANEKAAEAIETVFTARDTRVLTWNQIRNVHGESASDGGVFQDGPQALRIAGPDGLLNTADDGAVESIVKPGPDNLLGTTDDEVVPLSNYTREIEIRDLGPNLRQVRVVIRYQALGGTRERVLTTFISSYA